MGNSSVPFLLHELPAALKSRLQSSSRLLEGPFESIDLGILKAEAADFDTLSESSTFADLAKVKARKHRTKIAIPAEIRTPFRLILLSHPRPRISMMLPYLASASVTFT